MFDAKKLGFTEYQESTSYMFDLNKTASIILAKERIKLQRLLRSLHHIKDMSIIELDKKPIDSGGEETVEAGEEVS